MARAFQVSASSFFQVNIRPGRTLGAVGANRPWTPVAVDTVLDLYCGAACSPLLSPLGHPRHRRWSLWPSRARCRSQSG